MGGEWILKNKIFAHYFSQYFYWYWCSDVNELAPQKPWTSPHVPRRISLVFIIMVTNTMATSMMAPICVYGGLFRSFVGAISVFTSPIHIQTSCCCLLLSCNYSLYFWSVLSYHDQLSPKAALNKTEELHSTSQIVMDTVAPLKSMK